VQSTDDPLWDNCENAWNNIEIQLNKHADELTAILFEPVLQGAGGMLIYSKDFLQRLRQWANKNNVHLIADEIMTGIGRTGKALACEHADIEPDFLCLSKGLTSGWLPLSVVLTSNQIYDLFYDDYESGKAFLHSHTYTGNALAAAVASECLDIMQDENIYDAASTMQTVLRTNMQKVQSETGLIKNIRGIGAMIAADLNIDTTQHPRAGFTVYQEAVKNGALLRPLGNTIYWLPPLNTSEGTLDELRDITITAVQSLGTRRPTVDA